MRGRGIASGIPGAVAAGLLAAVAAALLLAAVEGLRHGYLARGFWRSLLLIEAAWTLRLAPWSVAAALLLALPAVRRAPRRWDALRRPAIWLLALALAAAGPLGAHAVRHAARLRPDIILVSVDTLRADRLRCLGHDRATTPFLDRLAADGLLFERCLAPAPDTPMSHMSLFTSLYPTVHGFAGGGDRLPDARFTLAEYLREQGYRTFATTDGGHLRARPGFGQGFERYDERPKGIAAAVAQVLDWIDGPLRGEAFFAFLHCHDVASPYDPPPPYRELFTDPDYAGGFEPTTAALEAVRRRLREDPTAASGLTPADLAHIGDRYDGGVRYADEWIGELVRGLGERGLLGACWLIVLSDHGEEFGEHGSVLHEKLYHTVTRVPLVVRPPGETRPDYRIAEVVELIDVLPTLLEIVGAAPADRVQGRSLLPLINGQTGGWQNAAFSELPWSGRRRAITTDDHHILTSLDGGEVEVYDYIRDRREQSPLPEADWTPGIRADLERLREWSRRQLAIAAGEGAPAAAAASDRPAAE